MEKLKKHFNVPLSVLWGLALFHYLFAILLIVGLDADKSLFLFGAAFGIAFVTWILFMSDIILTDIHNKTWILLSMIFVPTLAYPFYLIQRRKLINMARKIKKFDASAEELK